MSETITACENICRDFGWVKPLVEWLASLAPIGALIWAIYAYFAQRKADREDEARRERRLLYSEFLGKMKAANFLLAQRAAATEEIVQAVMELLGVIPELELVAPSEVLAECNATTSLIKAVHDFLADKSLQKDALLIPSPEQQIQIAAQMQRIAEQKSKLTQAMRRDLESKLGSRPAKTAES